MGEQSLATILTIVSLFIGGGGILAFLVATGSYKQKLETAIEELAKLRAKTSSLEANNTNVALLRQAVDTLGNTIATLERNVSELLRNEAGNHVELERLKSDISWCQQQIGSLLDRVKRLETLGEMGGGGYQPHPSRH